MYRYYGAPAVAFRQDVVASQAPAVSAAQAAPGMTGALTPHDLVSGLTASDAEHHAQVAAVKAPNGMAPAAAATVLNHAQWNAHFGHPLPWKATRKFIKKTCEVCNVHIPSLDVLLSHETGKKHKKNLEKLQDSITPKQENPLNGAVGTSTSPAAAAAVADSVMPVAQSKKNKRSAATLEDLEVEKRRVLEAETEGEPKICTMSNVVKKIPKVVQPVTCEVCKTKCNNLNDLRGHEKGKKHKKNLEKLQDSITPKQENPPNGAVGTSTSPAAAVVDSVMPAVQSKKNKRSAATLGDLEVKKRRVLEAGTAEGEPKICKMPNVVEKTPKVVQPVTCEVCKIQCTNLDSLRGHESGKKHKKNLEKLQDSTSAPAKPPNGAVRTSTSPAAAVVDSVMPAAAATIMNHGQWSMMPAAAATVMNHGQWNAHFGHPLPRKAPRKFIKKTLNVPLQPLTCEVCNVQITSLHDLSHETGKTHKKNLEKLQDSITPKQENPPNGAVGTSTSPAAAVVDSVMPAGQSKKNKRSAATLGDLEVKKRRVLEAGTAEGEPKICTMPNVVKKTPKVVQPVTCEVCKIQCTNLDSLRGHESGKKHKKNLEKLQDSTSAPAKPPNGAVGATTEPASAAVADGMTPAVQPKKNKTPAANPEGLKGKQR